VHFDLKYVYSKSHVGMSHVPHDLLVRYMKYGCNIQIIIIHIFDLKYVYSIIYIHTYVHTYMYT